MMNNNKVILVTGASSGIGLKFAQLAELKRYDVIWTCRDISKIDNISIRTTSMKKNMNVCNEQEIAIVFEEIALHYGKLDALVNCAGFVEPESILSTSIENWNKTINTNLTGTFLCCKYSIPLLKKTSSGKIINIASTAGITPRPGWAAYAAAKSGIISFSTSIAEELSIYNIKIFIICPGRTATPLRTILAPLEDPTTIMQPEAVAKTMLYCLSEEGNVLEGQPILVRDRF